MKGWPDYTKVTGLVENYDEYNENYPIGIGDGAARLGSIKTYDMRGRVLWMDDFEAAVLKWGARNLGVGGSQALTTAYARNGNQCVKLVTNTGVARDSSIRREFSLPHPVKLGIEAHIAMAANFETVTLVFSLADGGIMAYGRVKIDEAANQVLYLNEANTYTDTGLNPCLTGYEWHFHDIKVVWDYNTDEYLRILYDHQELNMHHAPMRTVAWLPPPHMLIHICANGDGANNVPVYIDDIIITVMEPE